MSTRCQIAVKGNEDVKIYKHSDGYPDGVMPVLTDLLKQFVIERGNDPEYCTAQIIRAFARDDEKRRLKILEQLEENTEDAAYLYSKPSMLSWGVATYWHSDIEYYYLVDLEKAEVTIYQPIAGFWDNPCMENLKVYKSKQFYKEGCDQNNKNHK